MRNPLVAGAGAMLLLASIYSSLSHDTRGAVVNLLFGLGLVESSGWFF